MKIECYISENCASLNQLQESVEKALNEVGFDAETSYHRINDEQAKMLHMTGSPTILVKGLDIFPGGTPGLA